jgi:hypothetical protein
VFRPFEGHPRSQKLCHNCDSKPVSAAKTDVVIDIWLLLILRTLLKAKNCSKIPAYRLARYFFVVFQLRSTMEARWAEGTHLQVQWV